MPSNKPDPTDDTLKTAEIVKIKKEIDDAEKIFHKELSSKYFLLDKFTIDQLKMMCNKLAGKEPDIEHFEDKATKSMMELPRYKEDYIHFIIDGFSFSDIKEYALNNNIVSKQFFEK